MHSECWEGFDIPCACHDCALISLPLTVIERTTSDPPWAMPLIQIHGHDDRLTHCQVARI